MKRLFVVLLFLGLVGCASKHYLLETNPAQLSDTGLLEYFHKLDKEITRLETNVNQYSSPEQRTSTDSTVKLMVLTKDGASGLNALRVRRTAVRLELEKRGLSPLENKN